MAIRHGVWVECDGCGELSGEAGTPSPAPFDTVQDALGDALANGDWQRRGARLLCPRCAEQTPTGEATPEPALLDPAAPPDGRGDADPDTRAAVSVVWPGGLVLRPVRVADRRCRPVVRPLAAAAARLRAGVGPQLDRSTLALWESWLPELGEPPPRPVQLLGLLPEGSSTAAQLGGYGASLLIRRRTPARARLAEADYHGITIVVVRPGHRPIVAVQGRSGPVPDAERTVAVRHLEEQLFAEPLAQHPERAGAAAPDRPA